VGREKVTVCDVDIYHLEIPTTRVTRTAGAPGICKHVVPLVNVYLEKYANLSQNLLVPAQRTFTLPIEDFIPENLPVQHLPRLPTLPASVTITLTRMIEKLHRVAYRWQKVHS